jgi:hypothetical protein
MANDQLRRRSQRHRRQPIQQLQRQRLRRLTGATLTAAAAPSGATPTPRPIGRNLSMRAAHHPGLRVLAPEALNAGHPTGTVAPGKYYVFTCADDGDRIAESDEMNNCLASNGRVKITGPDLVVTSVSNPAATSGLGWSFAVTDTVQNQGGGAGAGMGGRRPRSRALSRDRSRHRGRRCVQLQTDRWVCHRGDDAEQRRDG